MGLRDFLGFRKRREQLEAMSKERDKLHYEEQQLREQMLASIQRIEVELYAMDKEKREAHGERGSS